MRPFFRLLLALVGAVVLLLPISGTASAREGEPGARHTAAAPGPKSQTPSRADRQRERAREVQAHRKLVDAERQRHLTRVSQLRLERRRPDKAKERWWKTNIDQQLLAENQRHRQWVKDHRLKR